jgi:hypothetical protein
MAVNTFRLLSGPFQHLSPFENTMTLYESSNLSQRLFTKRKMEKIERHELIENEEICKSLKERKISK